MEAIAKLPRILYYGRTVIGNYYQENKVLKFPLDWEETDLIY